MRRRRVDLLHHAHDLLQFVHQHRLVLQTAGGIDEQHVDPLAARFGERIEGETGRIGAGRARDHRRAAAAAPDAELIDGGGAERVAGREHDRAALGVELGRELADGRGLAGAVDADDEHDERLRSVERERLGHRNEDLLHFAGDDRFHLVGRDRLVVAALADRGGNPRGAVEAEVGADQHLLDLVEHRLVELALDDEIGDRIADRRRCALESRR